MTDAPRPPRVYGDDEVGRILKRATELQRTEPMGRVSGITLAELEEIAAEAGIDPGHLRRAAMELETSPGDPTIASRLAGDELTLIREMTLPGELDTDGFERVVGAIQSSSTDHGQPSLLGRTLTWRAESPSKTRTTQLMVTSREGETTVRVEENLNQMASSIHGGVVGGGGVGIGVGVGLGIGLEVLGSALFASALPALAIILSYVGAREIYGMLVGRRRKAVDRLFDKVVQEVESGIAAAQKGVEGQAGPERSLSSGNDSPPARST